MSELGFATSAELQMSISSNKVFSWREFFDNRAAEQTEAYYKSHGMTVIHPRFGHPTTPDQTTCRKSPNLGHHLVSSEKKAMNACNSVDLKTEVNRTGPQ